ncbi:CesT family type III secretion system chaperone [Erwiniaceae bacterium BAC15a-03b]|uniref:CesT family type III secretion system chaperone n=1 Tax=Winslowiella arboricola TaxID=2978220 RepID=A0A9J6PVX4_9GAMM|nr:CesT family type III secretion system chaperone [Winslowiella arboricola]MCU5772260.1 CesT family type III secretion system chaperone [Winslowiella arboricola]MCU5779861.1 CesT family type III secretion system chaperone [Winslowiella arboricola]
MSSTFTRLMQPLLRHLNVAPPAIGAGQAIKVDFAHLQIQFTPLDSQELLMVATLGALPAQADESLPWRLLAENSVEQPTPAISLAVLGDNRTLILWSRERFVQLDTPALIALFERLVDKANRLVGVVSAASQRETA